MIKRVIVYTFGDQIHDHAITAAAQFAAANKADLIGLFVKPDYANYTSVYGTYPLNLSQTFYKQQDEFAKTAEERFKKIAQRHHCQSQWHTVNQYESAPTPSAYADYIFVTQPKENSNVLFSDTHFVDRVMMETGLPTFVIPQNWSATEFAQRPVLAWKESREAVRAVRFSMPVMQAVDKVHVVTVANREDRDDELVKGIEISEYLSAHQVQPKYFYEQLQKQDKRQSQTLLRHAHEHSRDLIIAGSYSHSRFREIVMGGMTKELLQNSPIPILFAH